MQLINNIYNQKTVSMDVIYRKKYFHIISNKFYKDLYTVPSTPVFNVKKEEGDYNIGSAILESLENSGGEELLDGKKEVKKFLKIKTDRALYNNAYYFRVYFCFESNIIKVALWKKVRGGFDPTDYKEEAILGNDPSIIPQLMYKIMEKVPPIRY